MSVQEILVPEVLAFVFMALSLIRHFVPRLREIDGLVWLPLVAFVILVGIFPAYGFRLELIPILVFSLFLAVASPVSITANTKRKTKGNLVKIGVSGAVFSLVLLVAFSVPMFAFAPKASATVPGSDGEGKTRLIPLEDSSSGREYVLQLYGDFADYKPLIFIVPPEIGSSASLQLVCEKLYEKGFNVLTYSRKDYDTVFTAENGKRKVSPAKMFEYWRILRNASESAAFNEKGKALEAQRKADLDFLLPRIPELSGLYRDNSMLCILVGYGAGGFAVADWKAESRSTETEFVLGAITVESRMWSLYEEETKKIEPLTDTGTVQRLRTNIENWITERRRPKAVLASPLPSYAGFPVYHYVSGRALETGKKQKPYLPVLNAVNSKNENTASAYPEGAGIFDFQDYPLTQPVLSFLNSGKHGAQKSKNPVEDTADIISTIADKIVDSLIG